MRFIKNKLTWIIGILIFSSVALYIYKTPYLGMWPQAIIAKVSTFVWIAVSAIIVYSLNYDVGKPLDQSGEIIPDLYEIPVFLILITVTSFIIMVKLMVIG